jgi:hypothetical protein
MNLSFNIQTVVIKYLDYCEDQYVLKYFHNKDQLKKLWFQASNRQTNIVEDDNNTKTRKFINNKLHCENGPANVEITKNKNLYCKLTEYYINNKLHRHDGPAYIKYLKYNNIPSTTKLYYYNGIFYKNKYDWKVIVKKFENEK